MTVWSGRQLTSSNVDGVEGENVESKEATQEGAGLGILADFQHAARDGEREKSKTPTCADLAVYELVWAVEKYRGQLGLGQRLWAASRG